MNNSTDSTPANHRETGTFSPHRRGFGFITPTGATREEGRFVPPPLARTLVADDEVVILNTSVSGSRTQVCEVAILNRARTHLMASVKHTRAGAVLSYDSALTSADPVTIAGLPPATSWVLLDISESLSSPRVVRTWEGSDAAAVRELALRRHNIESGPGTAARINPAHTRAVQAAVACANNDLAGKPGPGRADLRQLPTFTIDGASSRDLDDAISARREGDSVRVWVHIADVASVIGYRTELDEAALKAATTLYLPGWNKPMIDPSLSEDVLSLLPHSPRNSLTVSWLTGPQGQVSQVEVARSRIVSDQRLTYDEAAALLSGHKSAPAAPAALLEALECAEEAAQRLGRARESRTHQGSRFSFTSAAWEPALRPGPDPVDPYIGGTFTLDPAAQAAGTHQTVERLMVAANESVAAWLQERSLPAPYRHHPEPDRGLGADLEALLELLPEEMRLGMAIHERPVTTQQSMRARAAGTDYLACVDAVLASNLARATYSAEHSTHFALSSSAYLHFTSPIRRYADLWTHRIVSAYLDHDHDRLLELAARTPQVCAHITLATGAAARAEAQVNRYIVETNAVEVTAETMTGTLSTFTDRGAVVRLPELGGTGFLPYRSLPGTWAAGPRRISAAGERAGQHTERLLIGHKVEVRISHSDPDGEGIILAREVTHQAPPARRRRRTRRRHPVAA